MDNRQERKSNVKYAVVAFFAVVIFVIIYKYVLTQVREDCINDLREHMWHAEDIYLTTLWKSWLERPYLFWHLCVKAFIKFAKMPNIEATACTCASLATFCYFVTYFIMEKISSKAIKRDTSNISAMVACALGLVMPLYMYWFNQYQHEGQFTINPFFNPTHMAVKPFGLLSFLFAVDLILCYKGKKTIFCTSKWSRKWLYALFGAALFMSTFTKPTFMYMLLPTGFIYLLIDLVVGLVKKDGSGKKVWSFMWRIGCASIPSLLYLVLEYSAFYFWGGTNSDAHIAIYPFLYAWHEYSPNVPTSIVLAMSFPLWMLVTNWRYFLDSVEGRLGFLGYVVGTLEFSLFVETGYKLGHMNFSWPMMSGMLLFWVISGAKLVEKTCSAEGKRSDAVIVTVGWILLIVHLFSGLYYLSPWAYII